MQSEKEGYTEILVWGTDTCGQLGLGNDRGRLCYCVPKVCTFNVVIRKVACGEEHSAFITHNGWIYTMGSNANGKLGVGDRMMRNSPIPCLVESLSQWCAVDVACGFGHTVAVIDKGKAFAWGLGEYGALGLQGCESQWLPKEMPLINSITSVSCGTRHTAMVDDKGKLLVCGANDAGQLGTGTREKLLRPVCVAGMRQVVKAACGIFHTLALNSSGSVFAMGGNNFGQLGIGSRHSSSVPMAVRGLEGETVTDISAGNISAAVTKEGKVFVWGTGVFGEYLTPKQLSGIKGSIKTVQVRGNFGVAMSWEGEVYTWGSNDNGELGLGDYVARAQPVRLNSIKKNVVSSVGCGGSYVIALGRDMPAKYAKGTDADRGSRKQAREEDLLLRYDVEKQKCRELQQSISQLRLGKRTSHAESQDCLLNKLALLQDQLESEKRSGDTLLDEFSKLSSQPVQGNAQKLQRLINELKEENRALRDMSANSSVSGSMKVSEILKEYENRIEGEIQQKRELTREKNDEIKSLHATIAQIEDTITILQGEKTKMNAYYTGELKSVEMKVEQVKQLLDARRKESEELVRVKSKDDESERLVRDDLERASHEISSSELLIRDLLTRLEDEKHNLIMAQNDLQAAGDRNHELMSMIQEKEVIYNQELSNLRESEEATMRDIEDFRHDLNEKLENNANLKDLLNRQQAEFDSLTREIASLSNSVNKIRAENNELKNYITELEERNKRFSVRECESYARSKITSIQPARSRFVTPSPERFDTSVERDNLNLPTNKYSRSIMSECKRSVKRSLNPKVREIKFSREPHNLESNALSVKTTNRNERERTYTTPKKPEDHYRKLEGRPLRNQIFLSTQKPADHSGPLANYNEGAGIASRTKEVVRLCCKLIGRVGAKWGVRIVLYIRET